MRTILTAAIFAASFLAPLAGSASAQPISNDVMASCNQSVGQMKFDGWPADRNREMMMSACQHNGGAIPGAWANQNQQPAALRSGRAPQRSGRGG
ncbi:MAG: hypothetical protein JO000_04035 [Alphaproteobacteria bacterium]|nr:hypothetical protein [Alphaproteobacteria bacterium]